MTTLSPENLRYIKTLLERGTYASEKDALDDAVSLLKKRDELYAKIHAGVAQADNGELLAAEDVFERLERRATEMEAASRKNG